LRYHCAEVRGDRVNRRRIDSPVKRRLPRHHCFREGALVGDVQRSDVSIILPALKGIGEELPFIAVCFERRLIKD
jgi:hypothetical protein